MDEGSFEKWNEEMVEKYDIDVYYSKSNPVIKYVEFRRIYWILRMLSPQDHENILDVGCGAGHILHRIGKGKLYGIDLSPKMLSLTKSRLGDGVILKKCNAESIEYPDRFFEKIICSEVLEHTLDPSTVIREIRRVAKAGGTVVLSIPNEELIDKIKSILVRTGIFKLFFKNIPDRNEWHLHSFSLPVLRSMTNGMLDELEIKAIPHRFFPLRYVGRFKVAK
jgi:ubiquinone/menaquinone biosynthesis C-methylase UbiE